MFEDASSCRHGKQLTPTHTLGRWQPLSFVMLENRIEQLLDGRVHIRVLLNRVLKHLIRCSIEHFLCAHRERERKRGERGGRKQCDHYMIELCFVVPVAMLTRKIPSPAPGIAPVPSARVEVINFVRKTCCCALGKHIMAISCQFAAPPLPPHTHTPTCYFRLTAQCVCVCVCVWAMLHLLLLLLLLLLLFLRISHNLLRLVSVWHLTWLDLAACSLLCSAPVLPCPALAKDNVSPYGFACASACVLEL